MALKRLPVDFKEFIECLNNHKVRYLLVGGWAVGLYGNPRATKDIDFLISIEQDNIKLLQKALQEFGAPTVDDTVFIEKGNVFRMGNTPIQIVIINHSDGIEFHESYEQRNSIEIDGMEITVISKDDLIKNKKSSGRLQDLADADFLEKN
ncbi:MAG: hypothetical protein JXA95_09915 [Spirochaetales bacterium]|nr:hypothetical protein [Spirochaetales bacterium]